jgi:hypothetical protein
VTRRVTIGGAFTLAAFLALAWISATWSPLGRGPVLDGLGPLAPYRWVSPPPGVPDEGPPQGATFELVVDDEGSEPDVVFTPDDQVTLVMDRGAVGPAAGRRSVTIEVTPLDPATLGALPGDLRPFGNAVRIDVPEIERFDGQVDVVLLYPETITFHATRHEILWSPDGTDWRPLDTTDTRATQQAQATLEAPGNVVVGAVPVPHPLAPASPSGTDGGEGSGTPILIVVAGAVVLIAIGVVARLRNGRAG